MQLLVCAKSPLAEMLVMLRAEPPVLVSVRLCDKLVLPRAWLPKAIRFWLTTAPVAAPLPLSATVAMPAVVLTVRVPVRAAGAVGRNVTCTGQFPPAAIVEQLPLTEKSPDAVTELTVRLLLPVLVTVTVCDALLVDTA